jgi:hypothetical protein
MIFSNLDFETERGERYIRKLCYRDFCIWEFCYSKIEQLLGDLGILLSLLKDFLLCTILAILQKFLAISFIFHTTLDPLHFIEN